MQTKQDAEDETRAQRGQALAEEICDILRKRKAPLAEGIYALCQCLAIQVQRDRIGLGDIVNTIETTCRAMAPKEERA